MFSGFVYIRFYEELNDFLPKDKKKIRFSYTFYGKPTLKDTIESLGIPHSEIDLIIVNGKSKRFNYHLKNGDEIAVYPMFESFDITPLIKLRPKPLRKIKFILDIQLGKLTRNLRLLGIDSFYNNTMTDEKIVECSIKNKRIILTRDIGLLKRKTVTHGYWIRNTNPDLQTIEIINRFDIKNLVNSFTRCLHCNGKLVTQDKISIKNQLLPKTIKYYNKFFKCRDCDKIYWQGSHYDKMVQKIKTWLEKDL
jgi:uncharacterized protein with PIN domain